MNKMQYISLFIFYYCSFQLMLFGTSKIYVIKYSVHVMFITLISENNLRLEHSCEAMDHKEVNNIL